MIRFQAEKYLEIVQDLTEADFKLKELYKGESADQQIDQKNRDFFVTFIRGIRKGAEELKLSTLSEYLNRAERDISHATSTVADMQYFTRGTRDVLISDVMAHVFIQIDPDKKEIYLRAINRIGVLADFQPEVKIDNLLESHLCYALERYPACVHHLMIAVEVALRKWAKELKLRTKVSIDLEDMEAILREAEAKRTKLKNQRRSAKRDEKLKYISESSAHFGFIKDAWRKQSAHGREKYDEQSAKSLMNHVEEFMRLLAGTPRKPKSGEAKPLRGLFGLGLINTVAPTTAPTTPTILTREPPQKETPRR